MTGQKGALFVLSVVAVAAIATFIDLSGGLPSQLAHLYYLPVVTVALLLPFRYSLAVALIAGAAVSPLPDVFHRLIGADLYYDNAAPWRFASDGWIVRPLAFIAISVLGGRLTLERGARASAQATSEARGQELGILSRIDKMILSGASETESLQEISRIVAEFTNAHHAGIVLPDVHNQKAQSFYGYVNNRQMQDLAEEGLPLGEGVSGWALLHGTTATSRNVLQDPRYDKMAEFARRVGYVSAAAVPIILNGDVIAALCVGRREEHDFTADEIATLDRLTDQAAIAIANARQRQSLERVGRETAIGLAEAIENRDPYTGDHCGRLASYASLLARAVGIENGQIETIRLGAALHDVGKIAVPDEILKKPDKLTPDEYAIIKQHCYTGGQICKRISLLKEAYPVVYHHHERWDGRGYPDGVAGERIPVGARIVAVVDAYDAMTSDRPYRGAMPETEARAILRDGAGSQWDPAIVDRFLSVQWEALSPESGTSLAA